MKNILYSVFMMLMVIPMAHAEVDWDAIGQNLADDTRDVYDRYVYMDESKAIAKDVNLDKPLMSVPEVADWLGQAVAESLTFGYQNYAVHLEAIKPYFTDNGYSQFGQSLTDSNMIDTMIKGQYDVVSITSFTPELLAQGTQNGRYQWMYDVPVMMTYITTPTGKRQSVSMTAQVYVVRMPLSDNEIGLAIDQWPVNSTASN